MWTTVWIFVRGSDAKISILPNWCCWSKNCKVVRLINWLNPSSQAAGQTAEENTCKRGFKETGEELKDMGMIFGLTVTSEQTFTRCKGKHLPYNWITKGYERCQCDKLVFLLWMSLQHPDFGSKQVNTVGALYSCWPFFFAFNFLCLPSWFFSSYGQIILEISWTEMSEEPSGGGTTFSLVSISYIQSYPNLV